MISQARMKEKILGKNPKKYAVPLRSSAKIKNGGKYILKKLTFLELFPFPPALLTKNYDFLQSLQQH